MSVEIPSGRMAWRVDQGDSIELLRGLPPDSIDAIVQDPPAGISFMSRAWDSKSGYTPVTDAGRRVLASLGASMLPAKMRESLRAMLVKTILQWVADNDAAAVISPEGARAMAMSAVAEQGLLEPWEVGFLAFMTDVFVEQLRVAKPGAHALNWALPRTSDLTMMALRFAGWEVRDSLVHLFGSGMAKSLNVSKAIEARILIGGSSPKDLADAVDATGQGAPATTESGGMKWDANDGTRQGVSRHAPGYWAPTTEAAKQWDGWGTALSPGHECWILARKPLTLPTVNIMQTVERHLASNGVHSVTWTPSSARRAGSSDRLPTSTPTKHAPTEGGSAERANESAMPSGATATEKNAGKPGEITTEGTARECLREAVQATGSSERMCSNTTVDDAHVVASPSSNFSPSTISTAAEPNTENRARAKSYDGYAPTDSRLAFAFCAGTATPPSGFTGRALTVTLRGRGHDVRETLSGWTWPDSLPTTLAAQPATVAQNVQRWGTGGINVDACRTATSETIKVVLPTARRDGKFHGGQDYEHNAGRWPKNAVLSCALACTPELHTPWCPSEELGRQSGTLTSGAWDGKRNGPKSFGDADNHIGDGRAEAPRAVDTGTAARFFPHFGPGEPPAVGSDADILARTQRVAASMGGGTVVVAPEGLPRSHAPGCPVGELDSQSGTLTSGNRSAGEYELVGYMGSAARPMPEVRGDSGGASRYFPTFHYCAKASDRTVPGRPDLTNKHPTHKHPKLMEWLVRLITPPGGLVLDAFTGSGSTGVAAQACGVRFLGFERDPEHVEVARARIGAPTQVGLFG